ncbi:LacI family DNA-binding transcriptional regulator [Cohnella hashimotonis]|uniref:LacI family DNA-binding transcriptional regulator n=1 Tax=Cohnella hashimotonis TaxID=2826895 RepID=A0ABT6T9M4_9BACL|nr:LacI family DNA-binding transcriptional regulator [Cohnella hashimotonis]MDI4643515.1 LacI family DNA-binding transcriptional regulator [Cohnella hashimotonis]
MRAGIKQVAQLAEVSTATVSHVINNTRFVSLETKEKVFRAMEELDFQPNAVAQSLRSQRSNTIGLIVPMLPSDTSNFFFMTVAQGIQKTLKRKGYHMLLSNNATEEFEEEIEQIKLFNAKQIDGLIIASIAEDVTHLNETVKDKYPVVFIDRQPRGYAGDHVLSDGFGASLQAMRLLLDKGHKRIGFLTGYLGITTSMERLEGYKKALEERNLPFDQNLIHVTSASFDHGYQAVPKLLEVPGITALFVANNVLTMGAMGYLQEKRIRIPQDLAVIGYDDYDWTKITTPPLTVIRQPSFELGEKAAEVMLSRIEKGFVNGEEPQSYRLPAELVVRDSC